MLAIVLTVVGLLTVAVASAIVAYRSLGSSAWSAEYDKTGMGLTIELALLSVVAFVEVAISIIMRGAFRTLFLDGAWHSYAYLGAAVVVGSGVAIYMVGFAPSILARKQGVPSRDVRRECLLPYVAYTPFSIILWVGLVLPVIALLAISFHSDHGRLLTTRHELAADGSALVTLAAREPTAAREHVQIYGLEYQDDVGTVKRTVTRYLWVVGVFIFFLIVILNTRITAAYTDAAQDIFKWMMWALLAVAVGISVYGLEQYQAMRDAVIETHERIAATAAAKGQLALVVDTKRALLQFRDEDANQFLRHAVVGVIGLVVSTNTIQFLMAKITHRSAREVIFPRAVAGFLHRFLLEGDTPPPPRR